MVVLSKKSMIHIRPSRIFGAIEGHIEFNDNDQGHLKNCEECRRIMAAFQTYVTEDTTGKNGPSGRGSGIVKSA